MKKRASLSSLCSAASGSFRRGRNSRHGKSTQVDSRTQRGAVARWQFPRQANHQNPGGVWTSSRRPHRRGNSGRRDPRPVWIDGEHYRLQGEDSTSAKHDRAGAPARSKREGFSGSEGTEGGFDRGSGLPAVLRQIPFDRRREYRPGSVLRGADVAAIAAQRRWEADLSGGCDSRLAEHGVARRAGRHQPRSHSHGRLHEAPDSHPGSLQGEHVRSLHGARVRFRQPAAGCPEGSRAYSAGNQGSGGLCPGPVRHDSSRATDVWASPPHAEV